MYQLHKIAAAYGQRPSTILGIVNNGWAAWSVDKAVFTWAQFVDVKLDEVDENNEHLWTAEELLGEWGTVERFAPAEALLARFQATGGRS